MIAPAAAPIAASRCVCLTTCPLLVVTLPPLEYTRPLPPLDRRELDDRAACDVGRVVAGVPFNALPADERSAADRLSSE
jgi:hypothetical protein